MPWVHIKKRRLLKIIVESVTVASLIEPVISLSQTVHNYDTFLNKIIMFVALIRTNVSQVRQGFDVSMGAM